MDKWDIRWQFSNLQPRSGMIQNFHLGLVGMSFFFLISLERLGIWYQTFQFNASHPEGPHYLFT
jgi:hypothetical protein